MGLLLGIIILIPFMLNFFFSGKGNTRGDEGQKGHVIAMGKTFIQNCFHLMFLLFSSFEDLK